MGRTAGAGGGDAQPGTGSGDAGYQHGRAICGRGRDAPTAAGPNAVRSHHARAFAVLVRQLRNALLLLLLVTAVISFFSANAPTQ
jgi:hypothetical protein